MSNLLRFFTHVNDSTRVLLVSVLATTGCMDNERKANIASSTTPPQEVVKSITVAAPKPAATDPAAEQAIIDLINVHTDKNPAALAAFRTCSVKQYGTMDPDGKQSMPAEVNCRYLWPDRFRSEWKMTYQQNVNAINLVVNGGIAEQRVTSEVNPTAKPVPANQLPVVLAELRATWMTLLVPLANPSDRVAAMMPASEAAPGQTLIRVWVLNHPPIVLGIDSKTKLLTNVYFEKTENDTTRTWTFKLDELTPTAGVKLPRKLTYQSGKLVATEWFKQDYEVLKGFDPALFEKP